MPMRKPRESVKPGVMKEYKGVLGNVRKQDIWPAVSTMALRVHPTDDDKAMKFAKAQYRNLTGDWPKWGIDLSRSGFYDADVELAIDDCLRKWIRKRQRASKKKEGSMKFSTDLLEGIRNALPMSQIVGQKVKLTKKGNDHFGLCPFHTEKTPSFSVSDSKRFLLLLWMRSARRCIRFQNADGRRLIC